MPSYAIFHYLLEHNLIADCPVTLADAKRALDIHGPEMATVKGKITRKKVHHNKSRLFHGIPPSILEHHANIILCIDFFFFQEIPFFHSISRGYHFRTICGVKSRSKRIMNDNLIKILQIHASRGLKVTKIHRHGEFSILADSHPDTFFFVAAPHEHVPKVILPILRALMSLEAPLSI